MFFNKNKKTALITGATSGIGLEIAKVLAKDDFQLILLGRNEEKLKSLSQSLNGSKYIVQDLSKEIKPINENIDILINNAGITSSHPIIDMDIEEFDKILNVNLRAIFILTKMLLPNMIKNSYGRIVNIGSILSVKPCINMCHYTASKSGLLGLSRSIAAEVAKHNITCNVISPGTIKTPIHNTEFDEATEKAWCEGERLPIPRLGTVHDVAGLVKFIISNEASWITGQNIHINGGSYMT